MCVETLNTAGSRREFPLNFKVPATSLKLNDNYINTYKSRKNILFLSTL